MSYDPPRSPRHRATTSYRGPEGSSAPPWETRTFQDLPGYADAFDGGQVYGAPAATYNGPAYGGPGYDEPGYSDPRYNGPAYNGPAYNGPGNEPAGYDDGYGYDQGGYTSYAPSQDDHPELVGGSPGYASPRNSGPMLSAPDDGAWARGRASRRRGPGLIVGAMMGLLAAGVAIGIATLAAAFFRPQASPIIAVGEAFIDRTPPALKNFAVEKFGENDKTMLLLGMYVTIALLAMAIGCLARRHIEIGIVGVAVFGLFGAFVAYTRPASEFTDIIPSIIGGVAGVAALLWLARAGTPEPARAGSGGLAPRGYQWSDGGRS